jgi:uncharacterized membrane protein
MSADDTSPGDSGSRALPELHEALLDDAWLARLEADLAALTVVDEVLPRARVRSLVPERGVTLAEGFARLRAGELIGLQVRYRHDGRAWCDTLLVRPEGTKLVRMQQPGT